LKRDKLSIKWKVFFYMLCFTGILLLLLWFVQTVYLDYFYKTIKTNDLSNAMDNISQSIEDEEFEEAVSTIGENYDISILVTDIYGNTLNSYEQNINSVIHRLIKEEIINLYLRAYNNDGEIVIENNEGIDKDAFRFKNKENESEKETTDIFNYKNLDRFEKLPNMPDKTDSESLIHIKIFKLSDGSVKVVYLNSVITPVDATVNTLRIQLLYISVIMIVLSLLIAALISYHISKPIIKMNNEAKKLAKGDFTVKFDEGTFKEVSELSKTLNHTASELQKSENLQKEIIANVSHDLRTPLTMISAYSEVMRDLPGENTPENVQVIIDEAKRLTNLVNDLLNISKLQAGVLEFDLKEYNLTDGIKSVLDRYQKLIEQNGYNIQFINESGEDAIVVADEFKIYQVLYNLISNAINYTGEDKIVKVKQIISGSIVRIEVIDSGEGIEEDKLLNVWERYYKIDKEHKRAIIGTGLGLSIVQSILKGHNAKYGVISDKGKGSTFWFELKITQ